jgi:parallel beta-helix repeat protein
VVVRVRIVNVMAVIALMAFALFSPLSPGGRLLPVSGEELANAPDSASPGPLPAPGLTPGSDFESSTPPDPSEGPEASVASPGPAATAGPTHESKPIVVTTSNVTIESVAIASSGRTGTGIEIRGTVATPVRNVTIRNCAIEGFDTAIEARNVVNLVVEGCTISDAAYGGIIVFSGSAGRISDNTIQRIGPQTRPSSDVNAYGIALTRSPTLSLTDSPRTTGFVVDNNLITDIPTWHGLDTHAGSGIIFSNNTIIGTMRPIFVTGDAAGNSPISITVSANRIEAAKSFPGGSGLAAITLVGLQGGRITNNLVSDTYPDPVVYDDIEDGGGSTNLVVSDNGSIP